MPRSSPTQTYDVHMGVAMIQNWITTLKAKTGRTLDEWTAFIRTEGGKLGHSTASDSVPWLKDTHKIGSNTAWWLAERAWAGKGHLWDDDEAGYLALAPTWVDKQFSGKREHLRPIYDRLYELARSMGKDVRISPCQTIVPFSRTHVFAQAAAPNNSRVDLSLALGKFSGTLPSRIIDTGGAAKKDRLTHRIPLESVQQIDAFVEKWLRTAYDLDAPAAKAAKSAAAKTPTKGSAKGDAKTPVKASPAPASRGVKLAKAASKKSVMRRKAVSKAV